MPHATLKSRLSEKYSTDARSGRKPFLKAAEEKKLADFASNCAAMGYGFSKGQFFSYSSALAKKYG